jgi:hypothetical protein
MQKKWPVVTAFFFMFAGFFFFYFTTPSESFAGVSDHLSTSPLYFSLSPTPIFNNPVVPNAPISGYFDHSQNGSDKKIVFYDGRQNNSPNYGFQFTCSNPVMNDFVGCTANVSGVENCKRSEQLWYDDHKGIDYEYSKDWYTGATCDKSRFAGITRKIYAPAAGKVSVVSINEYNGNFIFLKHDLNNNGNYDDDNFRSAYLHFASVAVSKDQIVKREISWEKEVLQVIPQPLIYIFKSSDL